MIVHVFRFQPFPSRAAQPPVVGLRFAYDAALVARFKAALAVCKGWALDPQQRIYTAGGWLPEERCWFVEPAAWPTVRAALVAFGATCVEGDRPREVSHSAAASGAPPIPRAEWRSEVGQPASADDGGRLTAYEQRVALRRVFGEVCTMLAYADLPDAIGSRLCDWQVTLSDLLAAAQPEREEQRT
jgi:hypothetical protein